MIKMSFVLLLSILVCGHASGLEKSEVLSWIEPSTAPISRLQRLASEESADAQYYLGVAYLQGISIEPSLPLAFGWMNKAASKDHPRAQFALGLFYSVGISVEPSAAEAAHWFRKSALQGFGPAQYNLALQYANGVGVTSDQQEAIKWYRAAASGGVADAQNNLGILYEEGDGLTKDIEEAERLYSLAAEQGLARAQDRLAWLYHDRSEYKKAFQMFLLAARQGIDQSQTNVGYYYEMGLGTAKNQDAAVLWYGRAAKQGNPKAQFNLAVSFFRRRATAEDWIQAYLLSRISVDKGLSQSGRLLRAVKNEIPENHLVSAQEILARCGLRSYSDCHLK